MTIIGSFNYNDSRVISSKQGRHFLSPFNLITSKRVMMKFLNGRKVYWTQSNQVCSL